MHAAHRQAAQNKSLAGKAFVLTFFCYSLRAQPLPVFGGGFFLFNTQNPTF
jgi:hypothetical protein